ncbi:hypothetical protein MHTCC0001_23570 [Flavobacteriaceae bacterium MHTCC 0001]
MINNPKVTVICICYNHEKYVVEALNSVINQTYNNIQLIIVDDFSSDNSISTINDWIKVNPNTLFIENPTNLGVTKTFNNAFKYAEGDYIIDFAADDVLLENCIEKQIKAFQESKLENLAVVYSNINLVNENQKYIATYYNSKSSPQSGDIYKMVIGMSENICSVGAMVKTNIFKSVGGYDETLMYEDLDLWVRVSRHYNFKYIPDVLVKKRVLSNSLSSQFLQKGKHSKRLHTSTLKILKKILQLNNSKHEYKVMLKRIRFEFFNFYKAKEYYLIIQLLLVALKARIKSL